MPIKPQSAVFIALGLFAQAFGISCLAEPLGYKTDTRAYNLAHGRVVFAQNCMRCHESGRKGAPVVGDNDDWIARLEQPLDTMIQHALDGHGRMPARGDQDLTDQDVAAAVAYVVDRARMAAADENNSQPAPSAGNLTTQTVDSTDQAAVHMFLMLFGQDRWK